MNREDILLKELENTFQAKKIIEIINKDGVTPNVLRKALNITSDENVLLEILCSNALTKVVFEELFDKRTHYISFSEVDIRIIDHTLFTREMYDYYVGKIRNIHNEGVIKSLIESKYANESSYIMIINNTLELSEDNYQLMLSSTKCTEKVLETLINKKKALGQCLENRYLTPALLKKIIDIGTIHKTIYRDVVIKALSNPLMTKELLIEIMNEKGDSFLYEFGEAIIESPKADEDALLMFELGPSSKHTTKIAKSEKSTPNIDDVDIDNYRGFDSHEEWTGDDQITDEKQQPQSENVDEKQDNDEIEEDEETILNKELENRRKSKSSPSSKKLFSSLRTVEGLADYVPTKPVVSWKRMLIGKLEKTTERWGNRRSSRYNPNARIEERVEEGQPKVEVILDVSVSVSKQLLKGFLMQLYHILESLKEDDNEEISFKVGTFSTNFSSFTYIRSKKDIKEYEPQIGGGTDFEVAATSFSEDPGKTITKIVFTDGCLGSSQKTRVDDIIWIVFGDKMNFTPLGGRIIKVSDKEYQEIMNTKMYSEDEDNIGRRR